MRHPMTWQCWTNHVADRADADGMDGHLAARVMRIAFDVVFEMDPVQIGEAFMAAHRAWQRRSRRS